MSVWYNKSKYPYTDTSSSNTSATVIKKTFKELVEGVSHKYHEKIGSDNTIECVQPTMNNWIDNLQFIIDLLKELKYIIYDTTEIYKYSYIKSKDEINYLITLEAAITPQFKHVIFEEIMEYFNTNNYNRLVLSKTIKLEYILKYILKCNQDSKLFTILSELASKYSHFTISSCDFRYVTVSLIKEDISYKRKRALLGIINAAMGRTDPAQYFHFQSIQGSCIFIPYLPDIQKTNEFCITTSFNLRDSEFSLTKVENDVKKEQSAVWTPYLFSFRSEEGVSMALYVGAAHVFYELVVDRKTALFQYPCVLQPDAWHCLAISHTFAKNSTSFKVYADGEMIGSNSSVFPQMKLNFTNSYIGKSHRANLSNQFVGSMGPFLLWNKCLHPVFIKCLNELGPSYQGLFHDCLEYTGNNINQSMMELFGGTLSLNIILAYLPASTYGTNCNDVSHSKDNVCMEKYHSSLSDGVCVISTKPIENIIFPYGNLTYFYSICNNLMPDNPIVDEDYIDLVIQFLEIMTAFVGPLKILSSNFIQTGGYDIISWRLMKIGQNCFTQDLMNCILNLTQKVIEKWNNIDLFQQILSSFIFNLKVWKLWPDVIILNAISYMISESIQKKEYVFYIKKSIGIEPLTNIIMAFYNDEESKFKKEAINIKSFLLSLIKQIILQGSGLQNSEIDSALYYFGPQKEDYIYNLVNIMKEAALKNEASFGLAFCNLNSVLVFNELLSSKDPVLFYTGLEFFTLVINNAPPSSLKKLVTNYHIWSILTHHLLEYDLDHKIYVFLLRMMVGDEGYRILDSARPDDACMNVSLRKARVMQVFLWLVQNEMSKEAISSQRKSDVLLIVTNFITKLKLLFKTNQANRCTLIKKSGWQNWILSLMKFFDAEEYEACNRAKEDICDIMSYIAVQCILVVNDGWIDLIDLFGFFHYKEHYKLGNFIPEIIRTKYKHAETIIDKYLGKNVISTVDHYNQYSSREDISTQKPLNNIEILIKNRKHVTCYHIGKFEFHQTFFYLFKRVFEEIRKEILSMDNLIYTLNDPKSYSLVKNIASLILLLSDMVIEYVGGLGKLFEFVTMSDTSTSSSSLDPNLKEPDPSNRDSAFSVLNIMISLFDDVFIIPQINFKVFEEDIDIGQGTLIKLSIRLFLCKLMMQISIRIYQYWKLISEYDELKTTPINTMDKNLIDFFDKQLEMLQKNSVNISHPLLSSLISSSDFKYVKEILNRRGEFVYSQQIINSSVVYVLGQTMVAHYKRILDYHPFKADKFHIELDKNYFISESLKGIGSLVYEILINFQPMFENQLLGYDGKSLMSVGLKNMKTIFNPLEFVMLLSSDSWQRAFLQTLKPNFDDMITESKVLSNQIISQIEKRSCLSADFVLYSALFVQSSVYTSSSWKRSLVKLNKHIESTLSNVKAESLLSTTVAREREYINLLKNQSTLFQNSLLLRTTDHIKCLTNIRLDEREDESHHRRLTLNDYNMPLRVKLLKEIETSSNPPYTQDSMGSLNTDISEELHEDGSAEYESPSKVVQPTDPTMLQELESESEFSQTPIPNNDESFIEGLASLNLNSLDRKIKKSRRSGLKESFPAKIICSCVVVTGTLNIYSSSRNLEFVYSKNKLTPMEKRILSYTNKRKINIFLSQILSIFTRWYFHERRALEIFTSDRTSYFFVLDNFDAVTKIVNILPEVGIGNKYGTPQTRFMSLATPSTIFENSTIVNEWKERRVSNFEYLMFINIISGRTYQDINQYPIFPWVLSDYESENIDILSIKNYRDLSKPVGALNIESIANVVDKYMLCNSKSTSKPYHYLTYCSTPQYVSDFLIRLEPYTSIHCYINNETFSPSSNTFNSVNELWKTVMLPGDDVRELTPEMFYLPEMLESTKIVFSLKGDAITIPPVKIPPYAKSVQDFIDINSRALESPIVSVNLSKWIDLIFGFKQQGKEAESAFNVFNNLTYDSPVNSLDINSYSLKNSIKQSIFANGVAPRQILFSAPHPEKSQKISIKNIKSTDLDNVETFFMLISVTPEVPILYISNFYSKDFLSFVTISANLTYASHSFTQKEKLGNSSDRWIDSVLTRWDFDELGSFLELTENNKINASDNSFSLMPFGNYLAAACSYCDNSFHVYSISEKSISQAVHRHKDRVTCIDSDFDTLCGNRCYIVTGCVDSTVGIWNYIVDENRVGFQLNQTSSEMNVSKFLYGHNEPIHQISLNIGSGLVASSTRSGHCAVHHVEGRLISFFKFTDNPKFEVIKVAFAKTSKLVVLIASNLESVIKIYSNKGKLIVEKEVPERLTVFTTDDSGSYLIVSGVRNVIVVLRLDTLDVVYNYGQSQSTITFLKTQNCLKIVVAGLMSGELGVLSTKDWLI